MSDNDNLQILLKYRNVVQNSVGENIVIKDQTMLSFLAYSLSSDEASNQAIELAVDTLLLLSTNKSNAVQLKKTFGVFEALEYTCKRDDLPPNTRIKVLQLNKNLCNRDAPAFCTRSRFKAESRELQMPTKLISLHVHGLSKGNRHKVESVIVKINGVVSVVLDTDHQRCTLRINEALTPDIIATAIWEGTSMEVKLITRNRFGQEIFRPVLETTITDIDEDLPPYLEEEVSPIKKEAVSNIFLIKDKSSNWLNSALGFFQNSFYW